MMVQPGGRVGAILGGGNGRVRFLGWGTYLGYQQIPEDENDPDSPVGWLADTLRMIAFETGEPPENPKILLDHASSKDVSVSVVWGCECWWGPEPEVRRRLEYWESRGLKVVRADIRKARAEIRRLEYGEEVDHAPR